jgi:hypothetical protein
MTRSEGGVVLIICAFLTTSGVAQTVTNKVEALGTFKPAGPPDHPSRSQIGDCCVVDLRQGYTVDGKLSGAMQIDFRIFVAGPCGAPPGTYDEHWIAYGRYSVDVEDRNREGPLVYLADVKAGGDVEGSMTFAGALKGTLSIRGNFREGVMHYQGNLRQETSQ